MQDYVPEDSPSYDKARLMAQSKQGGLRDYIPEGEEVEIQDVPHSCPECGWRGHDEIGVTNHMIRQHPGAASRTREKLAAEAANEPQDRKKGQHLSTLGGPESRAEDVRYLCPICSHRAKDRVDLINHLSFAHEEEEKRLVEECKSDSEKGKDLRTEPDVDPRVMEAAARQGALPGQDGTPATAEEAAESIADQEKSEATDDSGAEEDGGPKIEGDPLTPEEAEKPLDGQNAASGVTHPADEGDKSDPDKSEFDPERSNEEEEADSEAKAEEFGQAASAGTRKKVSKA